jgi:hypothetical protein
VTGQAEYNRYVAGSSLPVGLPGPGGDTYQRRRLSDGRAFDVVKNFPTRQQLGRDLAAAARLRWTELDYYWLAACVLR